MERILRNFERMIVTALLVLMMLAVFASTIELGIILFQQLMKPPVLLLNLAEMLEVFGFFLMVLIGLELLESIKAYMDKDQLHVEVVFLVAIVAAARKIIIPDYTTMTSDMLFAIAAVIVALGIGFFLVRRTLHIHTKGKAPGESEASGES